nr:hypothetical protein [Tanacetum cinerariifolium]
ERVFPTVVHWRTNAPKDRMPTESTYSIEAVRALDAHRTPIQKQPKMLLCLVGKSRIYYLGDEVYESIQLDSCPKSYRATDSSGVPSTIERSPLDFAHQAGTSDQGAVALEMPPSEDVPAPDGPEGESAHGGKSLAAIQLGLASTRPVPVPEDTLAGVSDPDPPSFADPQSRHPADIAQSSQGTAAIGDPDSENASSPFAVGSPESIYRTEWGVANGSLLDTPEVCQDLVDHVAPPGYFSKLRYLRNDEFLRQYNVNLARQVATLQQQVTGEEKLKAAFEEFKRYQDDRLEQRCAEMEARLDALSIDFDEELYPY